MTKYIGNPIYYPGNPMMTVLTLDVEVESSSGGFPAADDSSSGNILVVTIHMTGCDNMVVYGIGPVSPEMAAKLTADGCTYHECKNEADLLTRAIQYIEIGKPTHYRHECWNDLDYLYARARALKLKIDVPDLDRMFRKYDMPFFKQYGRPSGEDSTYHFPSTISVYR